jgi:crossover junction endodeoxyribonuclease RuvC
MIFLGIDPGLSGALALWEPEAKALTVRDMPTLRAKPGSAKRTLDAVQLARIADDLCAGGVTLAVIEQGGLGGRADKRSAATAFTGGVSWGIAYGIVAAQFVPLEIVAPAHWKRAMSCPAAKDGARARASQLLPQFAGQWERVKDDGRAEAALLALYAEKRFRQREITP